MRILAPLIDDLDRLSVTRRLGGFPAKPVPQSRSARVAFVIVLTLIAAISLLNLSARPRFHTYNVLDVVQTLGIGVWFGVALMVLLGGSRKPASLNA